MDLAYFQTTVPNTSQALTSIGNTSILKHVNAMPVTFRQQNLPIFQKDHHITHTTYHITQLTCSAPVTFNKHTLKQ